MRRSLERDPFDYQVARDNTIWTEHVARSLVTAGLIAWLKPVSVLDPACGDGSIVLNADQLRPIRDITLGDISKANIEALRGRVERVTCGEVAETLSLPFAYDVVVLTEILEHVKDPSYLLRLARLRGSYLVASSPEMRPGQIDTNPEHLWQFDAEGYREMLEAEGWRMRTRVFMSFPTEYDFGIWVCS